MRSNNAGGQQHRPFDPLSGSHHPNADRHRYEIKIHPAKPLIQPDLTLVSAQPAHGRLRPCRADRAGFPVRTGGSGKKFDLLHERLTAGGKRIVAADFCGFSARSRGRCGSETAPFTLKP
jgi:hypothetical protein